MKLHLHVKSVYFAQIKNGKKTEEYRRRTSYWRRKLLIDGSIHGPQQQFEAIVIHDAYKPAPDNQIEFPWNGWELKTILHPHFGSTPAEVFAIKLQPRGHD